MANLLDIKNSKIFSMPLPIIFPMEPSGKILWFSLYLTKKIEVLRHSTPGISENARKKCEHF